ncbi:hypothetical protein QBC47DRAFT_398058 [Echria macrotheca]|uniref:Uncharacterized protein n=1 Tax=Echria macrotheca TaxID=438768 RepID=A0AAJ0BJ67_9PEZI|nr:hypothetical protein QBC47DRAFT_398058 [Echria macrotheca]
MKAFAEYIMTLQGATNLSATKNDILRLLVETVEFFERHRNEFPALAETLQQIQQQTDRVIDQDTRSALKMLIRNLYTTFLEQFLGVIVTTPVAASNHRGSSEADTVLADEAGCLREDEFDDPHHGTTRRTLPLSDNPFALSITNSTFSRAVHAGKTLASLTVNHRQLGDLYQLPSQLFYYNQVQPFLRNTNCWVPAVRAFAEYIMTLQRAQPTPRIQSRLLVELPGSQARKAAVKAFAEYIISLQLASDPSAIKNDTSRLWVELPGSQARKTGSSTYNSAQAEWVLDRVKEILDNPKITNSKGTLPAGILVIPLYVA